MRYFSRAVVTEAGQRRLTEFFGNRASSLRQLIWKLFSDGEERDRDFLWRYKDNRDTFWAISAREPIENPYFEVETKPYEPDFSEGDVVGFMCNINAVIEREGKEHDIVKDRKYHASDEILPPDAKIANEEARKWFERREEVYGFKIGEVEAHDHRQITFRKDRNHRIPTSMMETEGRLKIVDPEKFYDAAMTGIGPSKGYGCGLLMLRPE